MDEKTFDDNIPDYLLPRNQDTFLNIATQLGIFDQERLIFEHIPEYIQKTKSAKINFDDFAKFILNKGIQGLSLLINIKSHSIKLFQELKKGKFCEFIQGTSDAPEFILFKNPGTETDISKSIKDEDNIILKNTVEDIYKDIALHTKADIPFPTKESLTIELKKKQLPDEKIRFLLKSIPSMSFKEFTLEHVQNTLQDVPILMIEFKDENHIIIPTVNVDQFFKTILTQKIKRYVEDNPNIQDRIKLILKKNQKSIPAIETVFTKIETEEAFYWIVTFQKIMEYLYQHKSNREIYLHFYEAASLLYHYSLHLRKIEEKKRGLEQKKEQAKETIIRALISEYHFPWDIEKFGNLKLNDGSTLTSVYTPEDILHMIYTINAPSIEAEDIPPIIEIETKSSSFFIHKYRLPQFFISNVKKESEELQNFYIKKWAQNPDAIPSTEEEFNEEIKDTMSEIFFYLIFRVIPKIFSIENPFRKLFPDPIYIKNHGLIKTDLADTEKHKIIYEAFLVSLFTKKNSLEIKPLTKMFQLDIKKLRKLSKEYALRNIPFFQRGIFGWFFKALFGWVHKLQVKNLIKQAVIPLQTTEQFNALLETYKGKPDYPIAKKIIAEEKRKRFKEKQKHAHEEKIQNQIKKEMNRKQYMEKMEKLKSYFLQGSSIEEKLEYYSKQWNPKIGPAKEETENNVNSAVNAFLRKIRKFNFDKNWIELMAKRFTDKSIFNKLKNQLALQKYVEVLILQHFMKHHP